MMSVNVQVILVSQKLRVQILINIWFQAVFSSFGSGQCQRRDCLRHIALAARTQTHPPAC